MKFENKIKEHRKEIEVHVEMYLAMSFLEWIKDKFRLRGKI